MRVVHVITALQQGGAEAMLEKLVLTGRRINPEIEQEVISLGPRGVVGERLAAAGVTVAHLGMGRSVGSLSRLPALAARLRARASAPRIVQTWLWHADLIAGLCARAVGNHRVVWNLRNSMPDDARTRPASRAIARACGALSGWVPAKIICNSGAALRTHVAVGYRADKCVIIPNGFDLRRFARSATARDRVRARWCAGPDEIVVGMIARIDPMKDHATFVHAAAEVARTHPRARFVLVGDGVPTDGALRSVLAATGLTARCALEDRSEDVAAIMSALDVFCLASRSEGFPNVLGEAMACGTPSVATDVGDVRDVLSDARLVAPPGDPRALASRLLAVLALDAAGRETLGRRQRGLIELRFDIERIWDRYRELYASL